MKFASFCGIIRPMKKKQYIFIKDENGKRHRCRFIEGDHVSREELISHLDQKRISDLKFQMENIRLDDQLDDMQKSVQRSTINWRLRQLQREMDR